MLPIPHTKARELASKRDALLREVRRLNERICYELPRCNCDKCVTMLQHYGPEPKESVH
jgi:hypothetical protein